MNYFISFLFITTVLLCRAQNKDTLLIKLCENNRVIGDLINKQHSVFDLKRHFKATIDSVEYNFNNPNLLRRNSKLYLVSVGYSQSGMMIIALPAYVDSIPNKLFNIEEKQMHACYSKVKRTICEFDFDANGTIIGSSVITGFGQSQDCVHWIFPKLPSSISNMYLTQKP